MKKIISAILIVLCLYGLGRVYYRVTDGFLVQNILISKEPNPKFDVLVSSETLHKVKTILDSPFYYLGKGCQSYVFEDSSKEYVVKFFKYQRYRAKTFLANFDFIPWVKEYRIERDRYKKNKLENVYLSWKAALELAPDETGVVYVHLNKTHDFDKPIILYDKVGLKFEVDPNEVEFLIQKKATMIGPYLEGLIAENKIDQAKAFLQRMIARTLAEFSRGISDNDYALLQNTGVSNDNAVHIDVGQIIYNPSVMDRSVYGKELFNKTYKFRTWLRGVSAELADSFDLMLIEVIGPEFYTMPPYVNKSNMGDIPNLYAP